MVELAKQISVFLESKPGRLAHVVGALGKDKINLTAVTVGDSKDRKVLRFVTNRLGETRSVLKGLNIPFQENEVVSVEMRNQPGALAQVCEQLAGEHIAIDYAYCGAGSRNGKTVGVFKVSNAPRAMQVLAETPGSRARRERHGARGWNRVGTRDRAPAKEA
jgi:hypothetical protein